jgi:hypothetical protein
MPLLLKQPRPPLRPTNLWILTNKSPRDAGAFFRLCHLSTISHSSSVLSIIPDLRHPFINDISNNLPNNIQSSYLRLLLTMNNIFVLRRVSLITLHIPGLMLGHSRDASRTRVSRAYVHVSLLEPPHLCFTVQSRSTRVANHWSCCLHRSLMSAAPQVQL